MKPSYALILLAFLSLATQAEASSMVYHGDNPDISPSANPLNETSIANIAALNKPKNTGPVSSGSGISDSDLLKQSVLSGLAANYQQILTGSTSGTGTLNFGDGSFADYSTSGGTRTVTFRDTITGESTTISFPVD